MIKFNKAVSLALLVFVGMFSSSQQQFWRNDNKPKSHWPDIASSHYDPNKIGGYGDSGGGGEGGGGSHYGSSSDTGIYGSSGYISSGSSGYGSNGASGYGSNGGSSGYRPSGNSPNIFGSSGSSFQQPSYPSNSFGPSSYGNGGSSHQEHSSAGDSYPSSFGSQSYQNPSYMSPQQAQPALPLPQPIAPQLQQPMRPAAQSPSHLPPGSSPFENYGNSNGFNSPAFGNSNAFGNAHVDFSSSHHQQQQQQQQQHLSQSNNHNQYNNQGSGHKFGGASNGNDHRHPQQPIQPGGADVASTFPSTSDENLVTGIQFDCQNRATGHWRDSRYCDVFHACVFGEQKKTYSCPYVGERSYYDESLKRCEFVQKNPSGCQGGNYYH